jgi:DNA-binding transcriptional LysR family regulator
MTDRIEAFAAFARMMELGSFSAVGRQLGISQSTVSKHIASLESDFGTQLFLRTTRRISPTAEASRVYEHVQRMLDALESARAAVRGQQPEASGVLRVALPVSLGRSLVIPLLPAFLDENPLLTVEAILSDGVRDLVAEGFELAIVTSTPAEGSMMTRTLRVFEWAVVASPDYLSTHPKPEEAIDLERHDVIRTNRFDNSPVDFESENGRQAIRISGRLSTNSDEAAYQLALAGAGIAIVPSWLAEADTAAGRIVPLLPDHYLPPIPISYIYPQTRFLSRRARSFIDFLVAHTGHAGRDTAS